MRLSNWLYRAAQTSWDIEATERTLGRQAIPTTWSAGFVIASLVGRCRPSGADSGVPGGDVDVRILWPHREVGS